MTASASSAAGSEGPAGANNSAGPPNSADSPWPVTQVNGKIKKWIERLGFLWVEGQITQVNYKNTWKLSYITLRDVDREESVPVTVSSSTLRNMSTPPKNGDRVIVYGKPAFYAGRGSFSLWVTEIRHVGVGELLARIERLKHALGAEGLFDDRLKSQLPFLPRRVGLITGRGSAAERDVLSVARDRWNNVQFRVVNTAVQGPNTVPEVTAALAQLDQDPEVDVIIVARGGGSVEDLLPFSEEALIRCVSGLKTPVVSAIGHEPDNPLLDYVADLRAATPTDAAKRVVPDVRAERQLLLELRDRSAGALTGWVRNERHHLSTIRSRPVLADPLLPVTQQRELISTAAGRMDRALQLAVRERRAEISHLKSQVNALGPAQTLARGYAVMQVVPRDGSGPQVVTTIDEVSPGSQLRIRVQDGSITAAAMAVNPAHGAPPDGPHGPEKTSFPPSRT
ncbi:exodeoxyribonuclease VII large subunit [Corynebacterium heidelbergense]|uniref:Exodeoxyribonuclease 7 large subunit n=1 Tax=Corynebacterium heidelbergense TaxID=2055947 RepID=A0A364V5I6_9CORY|nr:exodeoxyribonuclease VII large subunit [Corynebacterium heidelbergense]RAV31904.1 exodeoxyribonuclease VII large subunit [Corynebacterium heidelbergense]